MEASSWPVAKVKKFPQWKAADKKLKTAKCQVNRMKVFERFINEISSIQVWLMLTNWPKNIFEEKYLLVRQDFFGKKVNANLMNP